MPDLCEYIARKLFEVGDDPGFKCTRIQFMAFQEGQPEKDCGGLCESSLVAAIRSILDQYAIEKEATDAKSENRPAPAVGQVWMSRFGNKFVISRSRLTTGSQFSVTCEDGNCISCYDTEEQCVLETDTYVGQFLGFKVEGME